MFTLALRYIYYALASRLLMKPSIYWWSSMLECDIDVVVVYRFRSRILFHVPHTLRHSNDN